MELLGGQLIVAEPKGSEHATAVAESSLAFDRGEKGSLYARAGIADDWIVNLVDRVLEVHRDPDADVTAPYGWRYTSVERFTPQASVAPLGVPAAAIAVAALLPSPDL